MKKQKPIIDRYTTDIYPASDLIVIKYPDNSILKRFKDIELTDGSDAITISGVLDSNTNKYVTLIILYQPLYKENITHKVGICAHEALHYVASLFDWLGSKLGSDSQEHYCYLLGWATKNIYTTLMKK